MEQYTNYLAHHGVKGMKWGVRRYQNKDGSLTVAGRKQYGIKTSRKEKLKKAAKVAGAVGVGASAAVGAINVKTAIDKKRNSSYKDGLKWNQNTKKEKRDLSAAFDRTIKRGKDKSNISPAEDIAGKANQAISNTRTVYSATKNLTTRAKRQAEQSKRQAEVKRMSNEELQKRIKRLELEKRYLNLSDPSYNTGKDRVEDVLDIVGAVGGVVGAGIGIGSTIYKLKHP